MKTKVSKISLAILACALVACIALVAGCGSGGSAASGTLNAEYIEETGAYKVTADDAAKDAGVASGGTVTVKEGDLLMISPDITKGKMKVTVTDGSGSVVYDKELDTRVLETQEVKPGTYDISMTSVEAGTTGSVLVAAQSSEEFAQQNEDLKQELENMNVDTSQI